MNEQRIREIARDAKMKMIMGETLAIGFLPTVQLKFAELLVKECAKVSEDDISDGDACCANTADRIARQIKKHFGVEE